MRSSLPGDTPEEQEKYLKQFFRDVFSTEKGKIVLNALLADLHYFEPCQSDEEVALSNYAKVLISERMGLCDTVKITDSLFLGLEE